MAFMVCALDGLPTDKQQCVRHEVAYVIVLLETTDKTCYPISSTLCGHARW